MNQGCTSDHDAEANQNLSKDLIARPIADGLHDRLAKTGDKKWPENRAAEANPTARPRSASGTILVIQLAPWGNIKPMEAPPSTRVASTIG